MLKFLIPTSQTGRFLLIVSCIISCVVYLGKFLSTDMIWSNALGMAYIPVFCIAGITLLVYLIITIVYCFSPNGHAAPLAFFIVGSIIAFTLPVGPRYEERLFNAHRSDFEQILHLARNGNLSHSQNCEPTRAFETPAEYKSFLGNCVYVDFQPFFSVQFWPRSYMEKIVYVEDKSLINEVMGCYSSYDGYGYQQMDKNWYLCSESP